MAVIPTPGPGVADFTRPGLKAGDPWDIWLKLDLPTVADPDDRNEDHWAPYSTTGTSWRAQVRAEKSSASLLLGEFIVVPAPDYGVNVLHAHLDPAATTEIGRRRAVTVYYDIQETTDDGPRTWLEGKITVRQETTTI